jgi:histidinol dehydrogenase
MADLGSILISHSQPDFEERFLRLRTALFNATRFSDEKLSQLKTILRDVCEHGDIAVAGFTEKFDGVKLAPAEFRIAPDDLKKAHDAIEPALLESLRKAIANVRKYQGEIFIADKVCHPGIRYTPIRRVGICIPGMSAPLPSTVIMTAVPAQAAGVGEIAIVSPPRYNGSIHPVILALCQELGIAEVYRIGGAQAVAAMAYGTDTIPAVDKIVGPGNTWVQMAKKEVFGTVGIDSIAGPSEVLVIADSSANPAWLAADMLSQAEHAPGSAVLFTDSEPLARKVLSELASQLKKLSRSAETEKCLMDFSGVVIFKSIDQAVQWADLFASEHLQIQCGVKSREVSSRIRNAGAIFVGPYSPVALGDYFAGPSHTLPTGTSARFFSPLSANDFVKSSSIIEYDANALAIAADDVARLARTEGLDAHARSVEIRTKKDAGS